MQKGRKQKGGRKIAKNAAAQYALPLACRSTVVVTSFLSYGQTILKFALWVNDKLSRTPLHSCHSPNGLPNWNQNHAMLIAVLYWCVRCNEIHRCIEMRTGWCCSCSIIGWSWCAWGRHLRAGIWWRGVFGKSYVLGIAVVIV